MALKLGTVTWNYQPTSPIVWEAVGLHRFGRGVTDFVRKLHENTIKATEQQPIHFSPAGARKTLDSKYTSLD